MNNKQLMLFDEYAKHFHSKHQEEKQKKDLEFWTKRVNKCETFEQLLSTEMTILNAVDWNAFYKIKRFIIEEKIKEIINKNYIKKPKTLPEKLKNLFK